MSEIDIASDYPAMSELAGTFIVSALGSQFTSTANGHIQTDIAGVCSLSGLMILQETVPDLSGLEPGTAILSDVRDRQEKVLEFMQKHESVSCATGKRSGLNCIRAISTRYGVSGRPSWPWKMR
jgi:hypothetical protein